MPAAKVTGGHVFPALIRDAQRRGDETLAIGWWPDSTYANKWRTPVAAVVAIYEFGTDPRRRVLGPAAVKISWAMRAGNVSAVDPRTLAVRPGWLTQLGAVGVGLVRESVRAAGLIDTGRMLRSVSAREVSGGGRTWGDSGPGLDLDGDG